MAEAVGTVLIVVGVFLAAVADVRAGIVLALVIAAISGVISYG